jgi:hypothetical protein
MKIKKTLQDKIRQNKKEKQKSRKKHLFFCFYKTKRAKNATHKTKLLIIRQRIFHIINYLHNFCFCLVCLIEICGVPEKKIFFYEQESLQYNY